jgi:hypothetical protein
MLNTATIVIRIAINPLKCLIIHERSLLKARQTAKPVLNVPKSEPIEKSVFVQKSILFPQIDLIMKNGLIVKKSLITKTDPIVKSILLGKEERSHR